MTALIVSVLAAGLELIALTLLKRRRVHWSTLAGRRAAVLLGVLFVPLVWLMPYPVNDAYTAIGFPIWYAAFEIRTGYDFVSPLTLPILIFDTLVVAAFPLAVLTLLSAFRNRARRSLD